MSPQLPSYSFSMRGKALVISMGAHSEILINRAGIVNALKSIEENKSMYSPKGYADEKRMYEAALEYLDMVESNVVS